MKIALLTLDDRERPKRRDMSLPHFDPAPEALLQGFESAEGVEIHVVSCLRQPFETPEKIGRNIWVHGLVVPKIGWMRTAYIGTIHAVRKKLREIGPDIVHGQGAEKDCAMNAVFSGYPNVLTIHGNMAKIAELENSPPLSFYWIAGRLETFAIRRTAGVLCNSGYTESLVRPRAKKTWRVPNPLRMPFFDTPLTERPKGSAIPTIVCVGTITPLKRQLEVLKIAEEIHKEGYQVRFAFVGPDAKLEYGKAFFAKLREAEEKGYATYLGTKSCEELIALFDSVDAMIHFSAEESFGLVVAEALARNLKFFGAAVGGVVDIATGVEMAELHPAEETTPIKKGIIEWLKKGAPKPTEAAAEIKRRYHPKVITERHLEIYREVLGQR